MAEIERYYRYNRGMSSERYAVLTAIGDDRPGLVAQVTQFLTERGGNIEDSRMVILGGEFGMLVLVAGSADELLRIEREKVQLEGATGMTVLVRSTKSPSEHRQRAGMPCTVTAEAIDREGIVRAVASQLGELQCNIVTLATALYHAPVTGSPLFRLEAEIDLPPELSVPKLRVALDALAEQHGIDIVVSAGPRRK
jgi:glycine cleavage system transcriptional repressor